MNCYICKKETSEFGNMYIEKVCIECTNRHIESHKQRERFMDQYSSDHEACPNCGGLKHSTTLAGYIYYSDRPNDYKDLNRCKCSECGNVHTAHDRVPKSI